MDRDLPPDTLKYLASIAVDNVAIVQERQSLVHVARGVFGESKYSSSLLVSRNPDLINELAANGKNEHSPLDPGTEITIPEISPIDRYATLSVAPGSSIDQTARLVGTQVGPKTLATIGNANPSLFSLDVVPPYASIKVPVTTRILRVRLRPGVTAESAARELAAKPGVHNAAPNYDGKLEESIQPDANMSGNSNVDAHWFAGWIDADKVIPDDLQLKNEILIAILDSGLDLSHPSFQKNLWNNPSPNSYGYADVHGDQQGYDFANGLNEPQDTLKDSHGTHVAGIASARFMGTWLTSFLPTILDENLKLMILRIADDQGNLNLGTVLLGIDYAAQNGAKIVSGSWTLKDYPSLRDNFKKYDQLLFVIAAGNGVEKVENGRRFRQGIDIDRNKVFPASYKLPNLIAVSAISPDGKTIATFSNFGPGTVQLAAPGADIESTVRHQDNRLFGFESGTSQAAPFVSLTAGLIWAKDSKLSVSMVRKRIFYTADQDSNLSKFVSHGRLNMLKAISVNQDLIELNDRTFIRGQIKTQGFHFAETPANCNNARKRTVADDALFRLSIDRANGGNHGYLFLGTHVLEGSVCDAEIVIATKTGEIRKQLTDVRDVIWHGIPQFESPD
jgi:subtilisin family serine protease